MIEANELRINNLLQINGNYHKVAEIKTRSTRCYYTRTDTKLLHLSIIENQFLEPIPLTEEILLKCGFEKGFNQKDFKIGMYFSLDKYCHLYYCSDYTGRNVDFLHQLQNLYFALTGQELEINVNN